MKFTLAILVSFSAPFCFAKTAQLDISPKTVVLPYKTQSCLSVKQGTNEFDIVGPYIGMDFTINNHSADKLIISTAVVTIRKDNGDIYSCNYSGDHLRSLGVPETISANGTISTNCKMLCGETTLQQLGPHAAQLQIFGYTENSHNEVHAVKIKAPFEAVVVY